MKSILTPFLFPSLLFLICSCVSNYYPSLSERKFEKKIKRYESRKNIIFLGYTQKTTDTILLKQNDFPPNGMCVIAPGTNTTNFLYIYKIERNVLLPLDSTACGPSFFLRLTIKTEKAEFLVKNWGCHYSRHIYLKIE